MKKIILCLIAAFIITSLFAYIPAKSEVKVFKGYFKNPEYSDPSVFLNSGEQTKITGEIQEIANKFNDKKDITTIEEIFRWMKENLRYGDGEKFGRTSEEVIKSRIFTGCTDMGLAFIALTRAKGIPSIFVQVARIDWIEKRVKNDPDQNSIVGHILVEVFLNNKWYLVDSTAGKLYLDYDKDNFSLPDGYYVFAKSLEVWDTGILNEKMNHDLMMNLFKDFDVKKYKNPMYDYIDLVTGQKLKSKEFNKSDSTVIGLGAAILGDREPVELFDSIFTRTISNKRLTAFQLISQDQLYSAANIILLMSSDSNSYIPNYVSELAPEITNIKTNMVISKLFNGRRVVVVKCETKELLLKTIKELPSDVLQKNYNYSITQEKMNGKANNSNDKQENSIKQNFEELFIRIDFSKIITSKNSSFIKVYDEKNRKLNFDIAYGTNFVILDLPLTNGSNMIKITINKEFSQKSKTAQFDIDLKELKSSILRFKVE